MTESNYQFQVDKQRRTIIVYRNEADRATLAAIYVAHADEWIHVVKNGDIQLLVVRLFPQGRGGVLGLDTRTGEVGVAPGAIAAAPYIQCVWKAV